MNVWHERVAAFAAIGQCAAMVRELAHNGQIRDTSCADMLIDSLFVTDPAQPLDIYAEPTQLRHALRDLTRQLDGSGEKDIERTRYVVGMLQLERKLAANQQALNKLGQGLDQIKRQQDDFNFERHAIIANLGELYSDVISKLGPRIQVQGNPQYLKQPAVQQQIRALLLAGIRSAVLWRQIGGKRRQIILNRSRFVGAARQLIQQWSRT